MSISLQPRGVQHARLPCPSPTPRACSNSCPSSQWCHPSILSYVVPFSSSLQSFPASESFPVSQLFALGGQSFGASALVLLVNIQGWFPVSVFWQERESEKYVLRNFPQESSSQLLLLCSIAKSCLNLCDSIDCSTPGLPVLHHLPEFAQTHVHWVNDTIQPSHPLSPHSLPAFNLSQQSGSFPMS